MHPQWLLVGIILISVGFHCAFASGTSPAAAPRKMHEGLQFFTQDHSPSIREDAIGIRFTGPISYPLAENLRELLLGSPQRYNHVVLDLDSSGGELGYVNKVVEVLREVSKRTEFTTRVMGGGICASGCIAVFMQGNKRKASGASVWVFHGACSLFSNIPDPQATEDYLRMLAESGVNSDFLCHLRDAGVTSMPGNYFISGYELYTLHKAGVIMELLPAWQPERPVFQPLTPAR